MLCSRINFIKVRALPPVRTVVTSSLNRCVVDVPSNPRLHGGDTIRINESCLLQVRCSVPACDRCRGLNQFCAIPAIDRWHSRSCRIISAKHYGMPNGGSRA